MVLNTRETRIAPKLSMNMVSPPWKLLLEALFLTKLSFKTWLSTMRGSTTNEDGLRKDISVVSPFSIAHVTCQDPHHIQIEESTLPKDHPDLAH
jgi:hypothetical protein